MLNGPSGRLIDQQLQIHDLIEVVVTILDARDPYTFEHSWRVAALCEITADCLAMPAEWREVLHIAAHLHDIGKVGVPDFILNKVGPLTDDEYRQMQMHSEIGYRIVKRLPLLDDISHYIQYHHERWDGRGYPCGLSGKDIPLGARIIAVADTFDAITTSRPYRDAASLDNAFDEIRSVRGTQLCPEVCDAFLSKRNSIQDLLAEAQKDAEKRIGTVSGRVRMLRTLEP
jgi:HD-GYP domain-containing protein (c-di-GMP phosphodiesterase class II)